MLYQKKIIEDTIRNVKFSGFQWKNNDGFFYSSYDKPKGSELSEMTDQHKLYYHKIGTSQDEDLLIFGENQDEKHRYVSGNVTDDGKYLFISASKSTSGNKLYVKNLDKENSPKINMIDNYEYLFVKQVYTLALYHITLMVLMDQLLDLI